MRRTQLPVCLDQERILIESTIPALRQPVQRLNRALSRRIGRHGARQVEKNQIGDLAALPIVVEEKEASVFENRSAHAAAELIEMVWRLRSAVDDVDDVICV